MVRYADAHWEKYNPNYREYDNDCTNFVSQIMRAGGWAHVGSEFIGQGNNDEWYYGRLAANTSYTWAGAENFYRFARLESNRAVLLGSVYYLAKADVLQADWDANNNFNHTMFVNRVTSDGHKWLTYHTYNAHNKALSTMVAEHPGTRWAALRT